jgi:CRP-like cAMP-binding protein
MAIGLSASVDNFSNGEMIFSEFEPGNSFYLIQEGSVELIKLIGDVQKTLDVLHPNEMFGEMAILEESPRSASAIAVGRVRLMRFDKENFESLMIGNPQVAMKLLKTFVRRIYDAKRHFQILCLHDQHARVADVFLMLDETDATVKTDADKNTRIFQTSIENIARWAGISTSEARDELQYFAQQNLLTIFADKIIVKNLQYFSRLVSSARAHEALSYRK